MAIVDGGTSLPTVDTVAAWAMYNVGTGKLYLPRYLDQDTGAGEDPALTVALIVPASGGGKQVGKQDDAAFTPGTDGVVPISFLADESSTDSVDEGDTGIGRMTLNRAQIVSARSHDGTTEASVARRANQSHNAAAFLASSSGTGTRTSNTITTWNAQGALITVNVTAVAVAGSLDCYIRKTDDNQQLLYYQKTGISGAVSFTLVLGLGAVLPSGGQVAAVGAVPVPMTFDLLLIPAASLSATINATAQVLAA